MITRKAIIKRIKIVQEQADDDSPWYAHYEEDELRKKFIESIAERKDELGELAKLVLSTKDIDFERYYD